MDPPCEIVRVLDESRLIDSESYERAYRLGRGGRLVPGYYLVHWPAASARRAFDESARFSGPYEAGARRDLEDFVVRRALS